MGERKEKLARPKLDSDGKSERVTFRLTPKEKNLLDKKAKKAGMNRSEYLSSLLLGKQTFVDVDTKELTNLYTELAREGNNLNQIAAALNTALLVENDQECLNRIQRELENIQVATMSYTVLYGKVIDFFNLLTRRVG